MTAALTGRLAAHWPATLTPDVLRVLDAPTPYLVTDLDAVARRLRAFTVAVPGVQPFYAMKCNPSPEILRTIADHEDLDALSAEDFVDIYRLNTIAPFQMIRACADTMRASDRGAVVNVASVAGEFGIGSSVAYAASKGALATMTKSLARVLAPAIRVNAVAPGYVGTGWFEKRLGAEGFEKLNARIASRVPMGFATGPDDIAAPIEMLLDPVSRVITGEILVLDAGSHLDIGMSRRPGREH